MSRAARRSQGGQGEQRATVCGIGTRLTDGRAILYIPRLRLRPVLLLWIEIYSIPLGFPRVLTLSILAGAWLSYYLVDP